MNSKCSAQEYHQRNLKYQRKLYAAKIQRCITLLEQWTELLFFTAGWFHLLYRCLVCLVALHTATAGYLGLCVSISWLAAGGAQHGSTSCSEVAALWLKPV